MPQLFGYQVTPFGTIYLQLYACGCCHRFIIAEKTEIGTGIAPQIPRGCHARWTNRPDI